jgi:hypothetical protein
MGQPLYIYVDVDDTLVRKDDSGQMHPITHVVEHVRELSKENAMLYCWSTGGEDHARSIAQKLNIEACFKGFLHKPQLFIDDQETTEWENFLHVRPNKLGTIAEYRNAVS